MEQRQRFPLEWPEGWPRTEPRLRREARYTVTFDRARRDLRAQLALLDPKNSDMAVLSTNVPLRNDGEPYSGGRNPDEPGVAVYFYRDDKPHVIACDAWLHVKDNVRAVGLSIEALRAIERAGASAILDRAYHGFEALPAPGSAGSRHWREVLQMGNRMPAESDEQVLAQAEKHYRILRAEAHPDRAGGDASRFHLLQRAIEQARAQLRGAGDKR